MSQTENFKFQKDVQRIEIGYKMLSDIESKIKGYFKTDNQSQVDLTTRSVQVQDHPAKKEFSEFNYMPMPREFGYSQGKNRSMNIVDSAPIVPKPEHRSHIIHKVQTSRRAPQTDAKNGLLSNLGVDMASALD